MAAPAPPTADPSVEILGAIAQLIQQYLQLGPDTPLAQTFSQVLPEIEQGMQGMEAGGAMPPPGMGPDMGGAQGGQAPPPEMMQALLGGQPGGGEPPPQEPPLTGNANTDFGNASKAASKNMEETGSYKKKKSKG